MNLFNKVCRISYTLGGKAFTFLCISLFCQVVQTDLSAQTPDLNLAITQAPASAKVGSTIAVQVMVSEIGGAAVPAGESIVLTVSLLDPFGAIAVKTDGTLVQHIETFSGFAALSQRFANNDNPNTGQVLLQIPWNESSKWSSGVDNIPYTNDAGEADDWTIVATIQGTTQETNLINNTVSQAMRLSIPNLTISEVQLLGSFQPGTDVNVIATIRNDSDVRTQEGIFFGVTAGLTYVPPEQIIVIPGQVNTLQLTDFPTVETAAQLEDFEMVILPKIKNPNDILDNNSEAGFAYIDANDEVTVNFPPLRIPIDADGNMAVVLSLDGSRPDVIHETIDRYDLRDDNRHFELFNVVTPLGDLVVDEDSFKGDTGLFNGLDPARISFSVRNNSIRPLRAGDNFVLRVILSEDDVYDPTADAGDMILREFDIEGGNGLGAGLLPNENISFDWIQQLPDNFEGDYYLLVDIISTSGRTTFPLENTPVITLQSKNQARVSLLNPENNDDDTNTLEFATERPTSSSDGRFVAYEQIDENGVQQIWYRDIVQNSLPVLVSRSLLSTVNVFGGNSHSLRPQISADGSVIVFHSFANDLVPDDQNEHADVFLFRTINNQLIRAYNVPAREEGNGPSMYPRVNGDGSRVVFHSKANNLAANGARTVSQQIFLWDTEIGTFGEIQVLTFGNNESRFPSIDHSGKRIVFASEASNLVPGDSNNQSDIFALDLDSNQTWLLSVNEFLAQTNGPSDQPVISGNGEVVAFVSSASNLVRERGISNIVVENGGAGYFGNVEFIVRDDLGAGTGAVIGFTNAGIDRYGQILPDGLRILNPGKDYLEPVVSILTDPNELPPSQEAVIKLNLSHPLGEVFKTEFDNPGGTLKRVSQSFEGVGGNMPSREASISYDGSLIVYSTKSSNLLDSNLTLANGKVYYNQPAVLAKASAILVGPIGEIEVQNPGAGYANGFLSIDDLTGSGFGAIAEYEVDAIGRISSINIINSGQDYNLEQTRISVAEPRNGAGFVAGTLRFPSIQGFGETRTGGGRVYRVEMLEHGMGYKGVENTNTGLQTLIQIQGDGVDTDSNGMPDAKIDPSTIHIDSLGGVYLEQEYEMELLSAISLVGTTLTVADDNRTITIDFAATNNNSGTTTVSIGPIGNFSPLADIRDDIIDIILREWNIPDDNDDIMAGPVVVPGFGSDLIFRAISGRFDTDNPTSVRIKERSNMLFSGDGYTRATPTIGPLPAIHGFSEVLSGTFTDQSDSGALLLDVFEDKQSDDIYIYDSNTERNERISRSHFGQPVNFLPETGIFSMPSNRFPFISGNGRHVFFSSDSNDSGGLAFGISNNQVLDDNGFRDVFHVDRKQTELSNIEIEIDMLYPNDLATFTFGTNSKIPVIAQIDYDDDDIHRVYLLVNNRPHGGDFPLAELTHFQNEFTTNRWTGTFNTGPPGEHVFQVIAINDANVTLGASLPRTITVSEFDSLPPTVQLQNPGFDSLTTTSSTRLSASGNDRDGTLVSVQYYLDGQLLGDEIFRRQGVPQDFATFQTPLEQPQAGIRSIFAVGRDNNDNYVTTDVFNVSVTPGSVTPSISLDAGPRSYKLSKDDFDLELDESGTGAIQKITLKEAAGGNFLGDPRIELLGNGINAQVEAILQKNTESSDYGKVTEIKVLDGGTGYDENLTIQLLPTIRNIGYGEPAQLTTDRFPFRNQFNEIIYYDYRFGFVLDVNGNPRNGYGYTVAPRLEFETRDGDYLPFIEPNGINTSRIPLIDNNQTTSSVSNILNDGTFFPINIPYLSFPFYELLYSRVRLVGGFTQAPMNFEFSVQETAEPIRFVKFFVNGKNEDNKTSPPYSFIYTADEPGDYDVYAIATDMTGNTAISETTTFSTARFQGTGVSVTLGTDDEFTLAAGSQTVVSAMASSDAGIAEVEFYVDGSSQGKVLGDGHAEAFVKELDLTGITQGEHELSVIARDFHGNEAGTFQDILTNIDIRQNSKIIVSPKLLSSQPPVVELVYPPDRMMMTSTSKIYLSAQANDPDGRLVGVQFYVNGNKYRDEILFDPAFAQDGYPYGIGWSPNDPHNDPNYPYADDPDKVDSNFTGPGVYVITAVARDTSGNKSLSATSTVTSTTGDSFVPSVDFKNLNSDYEASQTIFLSAEVFDGIDGSTGIGVVDDVEFYANGVLISDFNQTGPYFDTWDPDPGIYEVYALARDNEGNFAISDIEKVNVGGVGEFNETPQLGSFTPSIALSLNISRRAGRRNADLPSSVTSIEGMPEDILSKLVAGEIIRFSTESDMTAEYVIKQITNDGALELNGNMSIEDEQILAEATQIEMVPIFRAGSRLYLSLKPEVVDVGFDSVTFYVDGTVLSIDDEWPYSAIFTPFEEGNYTIAVVAENDFDNKTLSTERLYVSPAVGQTPAGGVQVTPVVRGLMDPAFTQRGVTIGSELTVAANFEDLDDGLSRVEFYLNGKLESVDHYPPYYYKFKPFSDAAPGLIRGWEVAAIGVDNSGNRWAVSQTGNIQGSSIIPVAKLKNPAFGEEYPDGQFVDLRVEVTGSGVDRLWGPGSNSPAVSPNFGQVQPRRMNILANGQIVTTIVETNWNTGIFTGQWFCDADYAGADGKVDLLGSIVMEDLTVDLVPFTPTLLTDVVTISITEPNLSGSPESAINQTYQDLLGYSPSEQELNVAVSANMKNGSYLFENDDYLQWAAELSERDSFQNIVDAISGYHTMTGLWPSASRVEEIINTYSAIPNFGSDGSADIDGDGFSLLQERTFGTDDNDPADFPPNVFQVDRFIDDTLESGEYTDVHGVMKVLTPPQSGSDRFVNYDANRREFVRITYNNKYGTMPTVTQEVQGSYRISVFDPNSQEAKDDQQQQMMQQLAMYSNFGFGGIGGGGRGGGNNNQFASLFGGIGANNNQQNQQNQLTTYNNPGGQPAVLYIANLIAENKIDNLDMIMGAPEKRDYYETAALIVAYWGENLELLSDELISEFHSLSTKEKIAKLMKNKRYFNRFGGFSISRHAKELTSAPGWKWLDWFGYFNDDQFPWIYHSSLGWVYVYGISDDQTWFYMPSAGWLGTTKEVWHDMDEDSSHLWLYEHSTSRWIFLILDAYIPIDSNRDDTFRDDPRLPLVGDPEINRTFWDSTSQKYFIYE